MRRLLGPHLGGQWANKLEILRKWQPRLILLLQPEVDKVQQLRDACPQAIVIGRFFHDDSHYASNINARPKEFAHEIHNEIANNPVTPLLDYAQSNNEVCQDWAGIQRLNEFTQEWMHLADQSQAYKCAILAFSVGNPDLPHKPGDPAGFDGRMLYWQQVLPSLNYAQANNHVLLMHAYGYPNMFAPDADWYIYRYERQVVANLRTLGITNLRYAYGEIGIDRLIVNGKGGYKTVTNDQDYVNQLLQWEKDLQGEDLLLGGAIFTFGDSGGWDTYDIASTNVASMIATHYADHAGDYDASGAVDEGETVFIPMAGTGQPAQSTLPERQIDPRLIERGVTITPINSTDPDDLLWKLVALKFFNQEESQGRHHLYIESLDESGKPVSGMQFVVRGQGSESKPLVTNGKTGFDATNEPMWASEGKNGYRIFVLNGDITENLGMGDDTPGGFNAGIHTSTLATYQQKKGAATTPTQPTPEPEPQPPDKPTPMPTGNEWERSRAFVRKWEGDYSDNPEDHGNWTGGKKGKGELKGTKFGISAASYPDLDIRNLTMQQADAIYFRDYWQSSGADRLPWPYCLLAFDSAVLHGVGASRAWQKEVGDNPLAFAAKRLRVYTKLDNWKVFGAGWTNRVADLLEESSKP